MKSYNKVALVAVPCLLLGMWGCPSKPSISTDIQAGVVIADTIASILVATNHISAADAVAIEAYVTVFNQAAQVCVPALAGGTTPAAISTCIGEFSKAGNPVLSADVPPAVMVIIQSLEGVVQMVLNDFGTPTAPKLTKKLGDLKTVHVRYATLKFAPRTTVAQVYDAAFVKSLDPRTLKVYTMPTANIAEYNARLSQAEVLRAEKINYDWAPIAYGWDPYLVQGQRMTYKYTWIPGSLCLTIIGVNMSVPGQPFPGMKNYAVTPPWPEFAIKVSQNPSDLPVFIK